MSTLKNKNLLLKEQILYLKSRPPQRREQKNENYRVASPERMAIYFRDCPYSQVSGLLGSPVAQWVKYWPTDLAVRSSSPARGELFSTINRILLYTANHYQFLIVLI